MQESNLRISTKLDNEGYFKVITRSISKNHYETIRFVGDRKDGIIFSSEKINAIDRHLSMSLLLKKSWHFNSKWSLSR